MGIPSRVADRISAGLKRFQPILTAAKARDVNESDTAIIVTDILAEVFGFDKYSEITSEFMIRSTYCDLAIKLDGKLRMLIEVKPVGSDVKDTYTKQAVDYAANQGVEWVALTTGVLWQVYRITFGQPISQELVVNLDLLSLNHRSDADVEALYLLAKEGFCKSVLEDYHTQRQAMSRYFLGAMILSDAVLGVLRRELKRLSPGVRIEIEELRAALHDEVIKREVLEGDRADDAKRKVSRALNKGLKLRVVSKTDEVEGGAAAEATTPPTPAQAGPAA